MKKEKKVFRIFISRIDRYEDHEDISTIWKPFYRTGVSEKQVIAWLRHKFNLYDHDTMDGQCAVIYKFDIEDAMPNGIKTLTVFDFDWSED